MENITLFEKSCVDVLQETMPSLEAFLLLRALERGDTALHEMSEEAFCRLLSLDQPTEWSQKAYRDCSIALKRGISFFRFEAMERYIAEEILRRLSVRDSLHIDRLDGLNREQEEAVRAALSSPLFFLTGGPGTGKTYTAGYYFKALLRQRDPSKGPLQMVLLAPTGKAVKALEKSIARALYSESAKIEVRAMTLHAFLGKGVSKECDIACVDESSMVGTELMYLFLKAVSPQARLLFLGDADQLPPIEPGQPFCDIVNVLEKHKDPHLYRLSVCERTDGVELLRFAKAVSSGEQIAVADLEGEVSFFHGDSARSWAMCEAEWQKKVFAPWRESALSFERAQALLTHAVLLTAQKEGQAGSSEIMRRAQKEMLAMPSRYSPVLVTKNNHDLQVMNGEIGLLEHQQDGLEGVYFDKRKLPLVLLDEWQFAYSMTVHKSQGSEFQEVHLLLPPGAKISRKLLYTAATRARKRLCIYGTESTLQRAVSTVEERMTFLKTHFDLLIQSTLRHATRS